MLTPWNKIFLDVLLCSLYRKVYFHQKTGYIKEKSILSFIKFSHHLYYFCCQYSFSMYISHNDKRGIRVFYLFHIWLKNKKYFFIRNSFFKIPFYSINAIPKCTDVPKFQNMHTYIYIPEFSNMIGILEKWIKTERAAIEIHCLLQFAWDNRKFSGRQICEISYNFQQQMTLQAIWRI